MEYNGCFNTVNELVREASEKFGSKYIIDKDKIEKIESLCVNVDALFDEIDCSMIDAIIDEANKSLTISIFCDEIVFENGRNNTFCGLIKDVDSFLFTKAANDVLKIDLIVADVWREQNIN